MGSRDARSRSRRGVCLVNKERLSQNGTVWRFVPNRCGIKRCFIHGYDKAFAPRRQHRSRLFTLSIKHAHDKSVSFACANPRPLYEFVGMDLLTQRLGSAPSAQPAKIRKHNDVVYINALPKRNFVCGTRLKGEPVCPAGTLNLLGDCRQQSVYAHFHQTRTVSADAVAAESARRAGLWARRGAERGVRPAHRPRVCRSIFRKISRFSFQSCGPVSNVVGRGPIYHAAWMPHLSAHGRIVDDRRWRQSRFTLFANRRATCDLWC